MFYDNSEEVFPNWWDALDEAGNLEERKEERMIAGERKSDRDAVILPSNDPVEAAGSAGSTEATGDEADSIDAIDDVDTPDEDSGPHSRDGYQYRISEIRDPRVRESGRGGDGGCGAYGSSRSAEHQDLHGYDRDVIRNVWEFAEVVPGNDPDLWRKDEFGNWIYRLDYGRRTSEFGWEIFDPGVGRHCQGVYAMRPMQWQSFVRQYEVMG